MPHFLKREEKAPGKDRLPFLEEIRGKIKLACIQAYQRVNKEIILLYWDIGKKIVEKQEKFGWGKSVVEKLSTDLKKEFPGSNEKGGRPETALLFRPFSRLISIVLIRARLGSS